MKVDWYREGLERVRGWIKIEREKENYNCWIKIESVDRDRECG